jgi:2-keto-4-pentenoate hydratase/2-oxohepta-3-ene-1,7-dioic acid hydratase in catechol pathway
MKLLSFSYKGQSTWGVLCRHDQITDLRDVKGSVIPTLREALAQLGVEGIEERLARNGSVASVRFDDVQLLPVIPDPSKIICIGLNYEAHRIEAKRAELANPTLFPRWATSQAAHGSGIRLPPESAQLDFEGEVAVIIGRGGRRISEAEAWSHIAGYAPYNDASIRDWQYHTTQWAAGKNFDGTGAFGPWMVTRGEISDGQNMEIVTRLNGQEMQRGDTSQMIFSIPRLINYISTVMMLEPGDVIVTGTPSGVGVKRNPQLFMKEGDFVEIEVSGLGRLANRIVAEKL